MVPRNLRPTIRQPPIGSVPFIFYALRCTAWQIYIRHAYKSQSRRTRKASGRSKSDYDQQVGSPIRYYSTLQIYTVGISRHQDLSLEDTNYRDRPQWGPRRLTHELGVIHDRVW